MSTLQSGQVISRYRMIQKIGSGGMGEVWSAEDQRLKRTVALKFLPEWTARDARVRARFEREAQAVAALNHPNIVTIHSVEDSDDRLFLTLELVEGESLRKRMNGPLSLDEIFALAIPLAGAVAAAHDRGILHRDLKPENVMVTTNGQVKVLDFGLAKLHEHLAAKIAEPDTGENLTQDGRIVGTAAYMSPEQAEGKAVGPESDVFALGILLYQMATGERPFRGDTAISLMSSILKDDPVPILKRNANLPRHLGRIVRRCLEKDPSRRYASARELRNELQNLEKELAALESDPEQILVRRSSRRALWAALGALAVMTVLAAGGWWRGMRAGPSVTAGVIGFEQQTFVAGIETDPAVSPNGQFLAYAALSGLPGKSVPVNSDIFLLRIDGQNPINLTADCTDYDGAPAFSPDGSHIAFRSNRAGGGLYVMGATGESVRRLTEFGFDPAWSPDGTEIVFATEAALTPFTRVENSALHVVNAETGESRKLYDGDAVQPSWSPSGARIAFWTSHVGQAALSGQRDVGTIGADGTDPVMIALDLAVDWCPRWSADGAHLFFASDRGGSMNLWRIELNEASGNARGEAEPQTTPALWSGPFSLSQDGATIAYTARDDRTHLVAVAMNPVTARTDGAPVVILGGTILVQNWDLSPSGEWIAFSNFGKQEDVYLIHPDGTGLRRLTDDLHKDRGVSWLDAEHVVFYSNRGGGYDFWSLRQDGSELKQLTEVSGPSLWMPQVSPDGNRLMGHNADGSYIFELGTLLTLSKESALRVGAPDSTGAVFRGFFWSPDSRRILGRWVTPGLTSVAIHDLGTHTTRVFPAPVEGGSTAAGWFPDGNRFVAVAEGSAWVVASDTGSWTELPVKPGSGTARLTRDGKTLHYVETATEADIWVAHFGNSSTAADTDSEEN